MGTIVGNMTDVESAEGHQHKVGFGSPGAGNGASDPRRPPSWRNSEVVMFRQDVDASKADRLAPADPSKGFVVAPV